jgi:hypothetical protein
MSEYFSCAWINTVCVGWIGGCMLYSKAVAYSSCYSCSSEMTGNKVKEAVK